VETTIAKTVTTAKIVLRVAAADKIPTTEAVAERTEAVAEITEVVAERTETDAKIEMKTIRLTLNLREKVEVAEMVDLTISINH